MNLLGLKTHSLFLPVDRLEQVELASLNNVVDSLRADACIYPVIKWYKLIPFNHRIYKRLHAGYVVDCSWLDERTESTDLNNVVGTIMINQQPCSYMIENVVRE